MQLVNEIALVILAANNSLLCAEISRAQQALTRTHLLRRPVLLTGHIGDSVHNAIQVTLVHRVQRIVLVVPRVQQ